MKISWPGACLVLAVIALLGCDQKGTAAAPQGTATPVAVKAIPVTDAFSESGDRAIPVDLSGLPEMQSFMCSVDSINETPASEGPTLSRGEVARFSGYVQAKAIDEPAVLVLRSDAQSYAVRNVSTAERADIAAAKEMVGTTAFDYSTIANLESVVPGVYSIEILGNTDDGYKRCGSSILVAVE